jgi:hypothetical protein
MPIAYAEEVHHVDSLCNIDTGYAGLSALAGDCKKIWLSLLRSMSLTQSHYHDSDSDNDNIVGTEF